MLIATMAAGFVVVVVDDDDVFLCLLFRFVVLWLGNTIGVMDRRRAAAPCSTSHSVFGTAQPMGIAVGQTL